MTKLRRSLCWALGTLVVLLFALWAVPLLMLDIGTRRARACLARIEGPRGPALPACDELAGWLRLPQRVPWTARDANMVREELSARMAIARYVDAAVGLPDRRALAEQREAVRESAEAVRNGTGLLRLAQLGPPVARPDLGDLAFQVGDADGLDRYAFDWTQWFTSAQAIEGALLRGQLARAVRLAQHYGGRPDHDLRTRVAALLCAGEDHLRGFEEVESVEDARADKRNANYARDFGSARVLVEACSARLGVPPPAVPPYGSAGDWDHRERLAVLRVRIARQQAGCGHGRPVERCASSERLSDAVSDVLDQLTTMRPLAYRAEMLGAVAPFLRDAPLAEQLARPNRDEPPSATRIPLSVVRLVERGKPDVPFLTAAERDQAVGKLLELAPGSPGVRGAAALLLAQAAVAHAVLGDQEHAVAAAVRAAELGLDDVLSKALLVSSVQVLGGDDAAAEQTMRDALPATDAPDPKLAALLLQLAELEAASAKRGDALALARRARSVARAADHAALQERAGWDELALESLDRVAAARSGSGAGSRDLLPFVGPEEPTIAPELRMATVDRLLDVWRAWLGDGPEARRAHRYQAFRQRGDETYALTAQWTVAGGLLDQPAEVEVWLDAYGSLAARHRGLRAYAWSRAQAARWRGDAQAAETWLHRFRAQQRWAHDSTHAELFQELGL